MTIYLDEEELKALDEIPKECGYLYAFVIKRHMDPSNGLLGAEKVITRQSLMQMMPDEKISMMQFRSLLWHLQNVKLIELQKAHKRLIIRCLVYNKNTYNRKITARQPQDNRKTYEQNLEKSNTYEDLKSENNRKITARQPQDNRKEHNSIYPSRITRIEDSININNNIINNIYNKKQRNTVVSSGNSARVREEASEVLFFLNKTCKKNYAATSENLYCIMNRLQFGYTADQCRRVIEHKASQWLRNVKMDHYLRPKTLFGDRFGQYIQELPRKAVQVPEKPKGIEIRERTPEELETGKKHLESIKAILKPWEQASDTIIEQAQSVPSDQKTSG
jgi:uncharacterized phage protein (TIGR02220 family)